MCIFCEQYKESKEIAQEEGIKINYYAILQERTIKNGKEKGTINRRPAKLSFCPMCGRKLENDNATTEQ